VITTLEVTDTFGTTTSIPATAGLDGPGGRWRLWELAPSADADPAAGAPDAATAVRVLPAPAPTPLEGPPLEEVLIGRDELANLAWLIELATRDGDGEAVDRFRRWLRLRAAEDPSFDPAGQAKARRYRLGTTLPDYWYPLTATPDPAGGHRLALASVPPEAVGVPDTGVQGKLVPHVPGTLIADEEASRAGSRLQRLDRLGRTPSGRVVWRARTKTAGAGEVGSGLRFDVLR
jgi:hypothetical protein